MRHIEPALGSAFRTAGRLMARASTPVPLGLDVHTLGIDLTDFEGSALSAVDQRELFTAGPLYLAGQLESAGVNEAIEAMSALYVSGALPLTRGIAANRFADLWEHRHTRFTSPERASVFARLFGTPAPMVLAGSAPINGDFRALVIDLVQALTGSGADPAYGSVVTGQAADALARNLAPRLSTLPEIAAHELLDSLRMALALFREPDLMHAVQATSPRAAVQSAVSRYVGARVPLDVALGTGGAGQLLLGWVASVESAHARSVMTPPPQVVAAAVDWARATLAAVPAGVGASAGTA